MFVFEKSRAVLGSVIVMHLSYRLFEVHVFKCLVVNRWLLGVDVQKTLTSHSSCWEQLWSWRVTPAVLGRRITRAGCCCLGYGMC